MQVLVESTNNLGRRLIVTVPAERMETEIKNRLNQLTKTVRIDGFRKGKTPFRVVLQHYGQAVRGEIVEQLLKNSLNAALIQEKLQPASTPTIQSVKADEGCPLEYTATFEVYPDVTLQKLTDVSLEKWVVTIGDDDVTKVLEQIRKQHAKWENVDRAVHKDDKVVLDMTWFLDPNTPKEQKGINIVLEEHILKTGLQNLIGAKIGDEVDVTISQRTAAGGLKPIPAKAIVQGIAKPELPSDMQLGKHLGVAGNLEDVCREVKEHMQRELNVSLKKRLKNLVLEKLLERHPVQLPNEMLANELKMLEEDVKIQIAQQNALQPASIQLPDSAKESLTASAKQRVSLSILYSAVIKEFDLKVDRNQLQTYLGQLASMYENPEATMTSMVKDKKLMQQISLQILEEQVTDKLLEQVQFIDKPMKYSEVIQLLSPQQKVFQSSSQP